MNPQRLRVLLADDEASIREPLAKYLRDTHGYQVEIAADAKTLLTILEDAQGNFEVVLMDDLLTPGPDQAPEPLAVSLTKDIKHRYPHIEVIVFTGWGMESALETLRAGAYRYLSKPVNLEELGMIIQAGAEQRQLKSAAQEKQILAQLMKTSPALLNGYSLPDVLSTILAGVQACGFDRVRLYLMSEDKQFMVGHIQVGLDDQNFIGFEMPVETSHTQKLLANPRPHLFKSIREQPVPFVEKLQKEDVIEWADIPLVVNGEVIGQISVDNKFCKRPILPSFLESLELFASQAASAIERARLREQEREASQRVARHAHNLAAIQEIFTAIDSSKSLDEVLRTICQSAVDLFCVDHSGLMLFEMNSYDQGTVKAEYPNIGTKDIKIPITGIPDEENLVTTQEPIVVQNIAETKTLGEVQQILSRFDICSVLIVPVVSKGRVLGSFSLDTIGNTRAFTNEELETCKIFANQIAVAIENAQTLENTRRHNEQLEHLDRITTKISASLDLNGILQVALEEGLKAVRAPKGIIMILNPVFDKLEVKSHFVNHHFMTDNWTLDLGEGITGHVAKTGKPYNCPDITQDPRFVRASSKQAYGSFLCVPIISHDRVLGTISALHQEHQYFKQKDTNLLSTLANHVAIAIESQRLNDISSVLSTLKLDEMLTRIAESACFLTGTQYGNIFLFDSQSKDITWAAKFPTTRESRPTPRKEGGLTHLVTSSGQPVIIDDVQQDPRVRQSVKDEGVISLMGVPLKIRDEWSNTNQVRTIGTLFVDTTRERRFNNRDVELLQSLASQAALAIEKTWLYDQISEERDISKQMAAQLVALHEITQQMQAALALPDLLSLIAKLATPLLGGDTSCILLVDEQRQYLTIKGFYGLGPKMVKGTLDPIGKSIAGRVVKNKEAIIANDIPNDARFHNPAADEEGFLAIISTPLWIDGEIIGTLDVHSKTKLFAFNEDGLKISSMMAAHAAIAIDNARLYKATEQHRQHLAALDEASRHIRAVKEPGKLQQEIVHLAVTLLNGASGCLCINRSQQKELEVIAIDELPANLIGMQIPHDDDLIGYVAQTGQAQIINGYANNAQDETIFKHQDLCAVIAVPLKQADNVDFVLFVADNTPNHRYAETELEILKRFAAQSGIALQTSQLISQEQRMFAQLAILHRISDYIQEAEDLDKILHIVLTGVTAGYGLGFNRAALLLIDDRQEYLLGRMGIGHLTEPEARQNWAEHHERDLEDFGRYLEMLERDGPPNTPIGEIIHKLQLPINQAGSDIFSQVVLRRQHLLIEQDDWGKMPSSFVEIFEPAWPLIVMPLMARDQVIGILVADNKFSKSPITMEDIESLLTFVNTTAVAIDNAQLLNAVNIAQDRFRSFYEASNALISTQNLGQVLQRIVDQAYLTANATGVGVILIDELAQVREIIVAGKEKPSNVVDFIRPDGLSMKVMRSGEPEIIEDATIQNPRINPSNFWQDIKAALCLPVSFEEKSIGVMWVHYDQSRRFSSAEIEALQLYVNQAALAYDSARRIKELDHMHRAAEALAGAAELPQVLEQIVQSAREVLEADAAFIWSYDDVRDEFILDRSVATGIPVKIWKEFQKTGPRRGGTTYTVMERGWVGVTDTQDLEQFSFLGESTLGLLEQIDAHSFQGLALHEGEQMLGVLYVNYKNRRGFSQQEQETAQIFANHAALALKNAKLLDQMNKVRNTAKVVAEVTTLEDTNKTLESIVNGTKETLGCDAVTLFEYDSQNDKLKHPSVMVGVHNPEEASRYPVKQKESLVFDILAFDQPYIVENIMADPMFKTKRFAIDEQIKSCVAIPLEVGLEKVGVMFVNYRHLHRFAQEELENIELFASQAAVAIRNTQLYEQIQKRANVLQSFQEASSSLTQSLDLDEILSHITEQAWKLMRTRNIEAQFSHLALREGTNLCFRASYPPEHLAGLQLRIGDIDIRGTKRIGVTGRTYKTGQVQIVPDVKNDPDYLDFVENTHSALSVPIKMEKEIIGVITIKHLDKNAFNEQDGQALETLAGYAAIAIKNANLFEETQRRARLLHASSQVARDAATAILDVEELFYEAVRLISNVFGFYHTGVFLLDSSKTYAVLQAAAPQDGRGMLKRGYKLKVGEQGIIGHVTLTGKSHFAPDVKNDNYHLSNHYLPDTKSEMVFPLISRGKIIGALDVQSNTIGDLRDEDIATLQTMADQLANAIHNAELYQQATERLKESDALLQTAVSLTGVFKLEDVLNNILAQAKKLTATEDSAILFWDAKTETFPQALRFDENGKVYPYETKARPQNGRAREIIDKQQPIAVSDVLQVPGFNPIFTRQGFRASLGVPLINQKKAIGVLYVRSKEPRKFSERQVELLVGMASQAAVAIDRARQYDELKQTRSLVAARTAMAWIGMVSATWRHAIEGHAMTIQEELEHLRTDSSPKQLKIIDRRLTKIHRLAQLILEKPITPPLSEEEGIEQVPINALLCERMNQLWENEPYKSVEIDFDLRLNNKTAVQASPEWLRRIFDILVDNAIRAVGDVTNPKLTVRTRSVINNVEIIFVDTGKGIAEDVLPKLFQQQIDKSDGLGIGLLMAQTIAQTYGGEIRVDVDASDGTSMVISLPVYTAEAK